MLIQVRIHLSDKQHSLNLFNVIPYTHTQKKNMCFYYYLTRPMLTFISLFKTIRRLIIEKHDIFFSTLLIHSEGLLLFSPYEREYSVIFV